MLVVRVSNCHTEAWVLWVKRKRKNQPRMSCPTFVSSFFTLLGPDCSPFCWAREWMSLCTDICRNSILESWGVLQQECITGTLGRWLTVWVLLLCCRREGAAQPTGLWLRKAKATWDCKVTPCCISVGRRWGLGGWGRLLEGETHVVKGEVRVRQNQQGLIWILVRNGWNHFLLIITV